MKRITFLLVCALCSTILFAQPRNDKRRPFSPQEFKQKMEWFIAKEAGLTQEEAKKFFPLYHEMKNKQRETGKKGREIMAQSRNAKSEADYQKIVEDAINLEIEKNKIEKIYLKKFHSALSWEKIHKVKIAESRFNMEALRNFTPRRPNRK